MTKIIGLIGKARSGKDTAGDHIISILENSIKIAIATPLKMEAIRMLDGIDDIETLDYYKNNNILYNGINIRKLLQDIADKHRKNDPEYYVGLLIEKIEDLIALGYKYIIVSDIRFPTEDDALRTMCGEYYNSIKIIRNDVEISESSHISETLIDGIHSDYNIYNNSTLEEYINNIDEKIKDIIK